MKMKKKRIEDRNEQKRGLQFSAFKLELPQHENGRCPLMATMVWAIAESISLRQPA